MAMINPFQKRKVQITLDIECFDDINFEEIDWESVFNLEPDESVEVRIYEDNLADVW